METELFVMESGALASLPEVLKSCFSFDGVWIVADENTYRAVGARAAEILRAAGIRVAAPKVFPAHPMLHGSEEIAQQLAGEIPENCVPVAIGSGTINDLVKRASHLAGKRYCCVATAPSVDGYTSFGAALVTAGFKKTMPCRAPLAVVADADVLRSAPPEMAAAGYADLMAKIPGGADWLIADTIGETPLDPPSWELVQLHLREHLADPAALEPLFMGLAATGYAMQLYHDSRPASGAEHLFSHVWEMEHLTCAGTDVSHGFKVSVGSVASTALMEFVLSLDGCAAEKQAAAPLTPRERGAEIDRLLARGCYGSGVREIALEKFFEGEALAARRKRIFSCWEELQLRLRKQLFPLDELRSKLRRASCPVAPEEIGLDREQFLHGIPTAQCIRKRYTILDLLAEAGLMKPALEYVEKRVCSR